MESKTLNISKEEKTVVNIGFVDVGNNFELSHFLNFMDDDQLEFVENVLNCLDLSGDIRFIYKSNVYNKCKLDLSVYDLNDFLKSEIKARY